MSRAQVQLPFPILRMPTAKQKKMIHREEDGTQRSREKRQRAPEREKLGSFSAIWERPPASPRGPVSPADSPQARHCPSVGGALCLTTPTGGIRGGPACEVGML